MKQGGQVIGTDRATSPGISCPCFEGQLNAKHVLTRQISSISPITELNGFLHHVSPHWYTLLCSDNVQSEEKF
jgi:hypothetical protein